MKYTRMVCWVRPQDRKELEEAIKDIPLEFTDSLSEFENKITKKSYLIVSLGLVNNELKEFVKKFPKNIFNLYRLKMLEEQTAEQTEIMDYDNVTIGQYEADELKNNYLGNIKDLWKYRLFENPTVVNC